MPVSRHAIHRLRPASVLGLFAALLAAGSPSAPAQGTRLWTQSQLEEFEKGSQQGVAIESDGHLRQGPALGELLTTGSTFVWSVAVDKSGTVFAATGSPASVVRIGRDAKPFTLFETRDLSVQALRIGPDGSLYAATLPSGKVYRLKPDAGARQNESNATVVFDAAKAGQSPDESKLAPTKSSYIWDLTFDSAGRLYIAAGGLAAVYRIDPAKAGSRPELFFNSDEAHIRALAWDSKGNLIAGSDGSGLVYRIGPDGKGYVLFEAPRREITSVAVAADGTIYAACVGDKTRNPLPPLPVQGIGVVTMNIVQPGSLQAANTSASLPEGTEIFALVDGQAPRKVWSGKDDIVYALAATPDGLLALTGNRGHIFRIRKDGSFADLAHLDAQQGLSLALVPGTGQAVVGTGNTGRVFRLGDAELHQYLSDVFDAGALARFGRVEVEPGSSGFELSTRSGNVQQPLRGWSEWQPLKDGAVVSPAGRFLQWKALLHTGGVVGSVAVNYLAVNAAPRVDELTVVTGARWSPQPLPAAQPQTVNITFAPVPSAADTTATDPAATAPLMASKDRTAITVRWSAHDDNGDDLVYSLYLRGDGETTWRLLKDKIADKAYSFDATLIPDGGYQVKVVASDAPSHTPADALTGEKISPRFEVDTTPPSIANLKAAREAACAAPPCSNAIAVTFDAIDASSPIARAEYSLDAGPWQYIEPVGKISDARTEHYSLRVPLDAASDIDSEHLITVRAFDRYENLAAAKKVIPATEMQPKYSMRFELFFAARYLKAKRRQAVVGLVTAISAAGVAAGVAALVIALAITNGMRRDLQDRLLGSSAHVQLMRVAGDGIRNWRPLARTPANTAARHRGLARPLRAGPGRPRRPRWRRPARRHSSRSRNTRSATCCPRPRPARRALQPQLGRPQPPPRNRAELPPIVLGSDLAEPSALQVGDQVMVISPQGEMNPVIGLVPKYSAFRVAGIFHSGFYQYDSSWAFCASPMRSASSMSPTCSPSSASKSTTSTALQRSAPRSSKPPAMAS